MADDKKPVHNYLGYTEFIESVETWNSGGNVMLDIVKLKSGQILIISDEAVCKYNSISEFYGDDGEYDYALYCTSLIEEPIKTYQPTFNASMIGRPFVYKGVEITNPFLSSCGRFKVDPKREYGKAYLDSLEGK